MVAVALKIFSTFIKASKLTENLSSTKVVGTALMPYIKYRLTLVNSLNIAALEFAPNVLPKSKQKPIKKFQDIIYSNSSCNGC